MTIDGAAVAGAASFAVVDPATGRVFAHAPAASPEQLDLAMAAAARAQPEWAGDEDGRRRALAEAARLLLRRADDLAGILSTEQGKPRRDAIAEVAAAAAWLRYYADLDRAGEVVAFDGHRRAEVRRRPLGVVAAITPWNFPLALAAWKLAPALRAGNTVVLKPSPYTPLATLAMAELVRDVLPPGILNVVTGPDPLGDWMVRHATPAKVSFTGSTETGRRVAATAAAGLKRVTLELGGNDAAVVLDDADPDQCADALFWGAFVNNGQMCVAVKRLYVARSRHDALVAALADRARSVRVGAAAERGVRLGPVANRRQFERIARLVLDARRRGAVVAAGGRALRRPGYFFAPTILAGLDDGVRVVDEEQFGPVLPVIVYDRLDDAVARANATPYGLSGSVWSGDPQRAAAVAARLEAGQVSVNEHGVGVRPELPLSGHKSSGIGVENGPWGLDEYANLQACVEPAGRA